MASKFDSSRIRICEGDACKGSLDVINYHVTVRKNLCEDCGQGIPIGELNLMCDTHNKPMRRYCETHGHGVCSVCVKKKHRRTCQLRSIEDAMVDNRSQLLHLKAQLQKRAAMNTAYGEQLLQTKADIFAHLAAVKKDVDDTLGEILRKDKAREMREARRINREADEKNKKLYAEIERLQAMRMELIEQKVKRAEI